MWRVCIDNVSFKVVSQHSGILAPIAVKAVKAVIDPATDTNVNLRMIKIVKKLGETVEKSQMIDGALIEQKSMGHGGSDFYNLDNGNGCNSLANLGPTRVEKAKIGLITFQLSPPKTNMENQVVISDYTQMDRALREERAYILDICKQIKKVGCAPYPEVHIEVVAAIMSSYPALVETFLLSLRMQLPSSDYTSSPRWGSWSSRRLSARMLSSIHGFSDFAQLLRWITS